MRRETSEGRPKTLRGKRDARTFMGSIFVVSLLLITSLSSLLVIVPNNSADILKQYTEAAEGGNGGSFDPENEFATAAGVSGDQYIYGEEMFGPYGKYCLAYSVSGSNATLVGWGNLPGYDQPGGNIVIPSTVSDGSATYNVVSIGDLAFENCYYVYSVMIPSSITSIGSGAFSMCARLTSFDVDADNQIYVSVDGVLYNRSMTEIVAYPTYHAQSSFIVPSSITSISDYAFKGSQYLRSMVIPSSVTHIGNSAFSYCQNLASIDVDGRNQSYVSVDGVLYDKSMTELISYPASKPDVSFAIPSSVTVIADEAFFGVQTLTTVTIHSNVISIGARAFTYCMSLASVNIPESVTNIGARAFAQCLSLETIEVDANNPAYVSEDGVLYDASKTELLSYPSMKRGSFTIPSTVITIADFAFSNCINLTSLEMYENVKYIGESAFFSCMSMTSLTLSSELKEIGLRAFGNCINLTSVAIPSGVKYIGESAFESCSGLVSLTISPGVTHIGKNAFFICSKLTSVDLPNTIEYIGNNAFNGCSDLVSIDLPDSVTQIGTGVFGQCYNLASIEIDAANPNYMLQDGVLYNKDQTVLLAYPAGKTDTSFTIPSTVVKISDYAFDYCYDITSVTLPANLVHIGYWAFSGCNNLVSLSIPSGVTHIGNFAFRGCSSLSSISIPDSVTYIGGGTFDNCRNISALSVDPNNQNYMSENGVLYNKDQTVLLAYPAGKTDTSFTIPSTVIILLEYSFSNCTHLNSITIPEGVKKIYEGTFTDCLGLTTVDLPTSLVTICMNAFLYCGLTSVNIPEGVVNIEGYAFQNCEKLTSVSIPSSVTFIGYGFVSGCRDLASITVDNGNEYYVVDDGVLYNDSMTELITYPAAKAETSFTIPSTVIWIGQNAFMYCNALTSVTIPSGTVYIGGQAFYSCSALTTVTIPSAVAYIGYSAFISSAKEVFFETEQLPFMERNIFNADASYYSNGVHDATWWTTPGFTYDQSKTGVYYDVDLKPLDGDLFTGVTERFKSALGSSDVTIQQSWVDALQSGMRYSTDDGLTWNPKSDLVGAMTTNAIGYGVLGNALRYDVQGGEGNYLQGGTGTVTLYDGSDFSKRGYKLEGWMTEPNGAGIFHALGEQGFDLSADTTLYAKWAPIQYRIEFNGNGSTGGFMSGIDMNFDASKVLSDNSFTWDGHVFKGWALTPDGPVVYQSGDSILNITDVDGTVITLYAVWESFAAHPPSDGDMAVITLAAIIVAVAMLAAFFIYKKMKGGAETDPPSEASEDDSEDEENEDAGEEPREQLSVMNGK